MVEARGVTSQQIIIAVLIAIVTLESLVIVLLWRATLRREERERFRQAVCR